MARTWLEITVKLVSGRGEDYWPRPGRIFLAKRSTTFRELARAINDAFGRWDLSHLHHFELSDGSEIVPLDLWDDSPDGVLDDTRTSLSRLKGGDPAVRVRQRSPSPTPELSGERPAEGPLKPLPVDLEDLAMQLDSDGSLGEWRIDVESGRMWPDDPLEIMGDDPPEHWDDESRWLEIESLGSGGPWEDMRAFIDNVSDAGLAERLHGAIHGRGAFRNFKAIVYADDALRGEWQTDEHARQLQRAREWLADRGFRPVDPRP